MILWFPDFSGCKPYTRKVNVSSSNHEVSTFWTLFRFMTVVYINAVQYQTCPNHESDNHFFAKIPGGGVRTPGPPLWIRPWPTNRLAVAALVNSVFINVQADMAAGARRINICIFFTNHKLPSLHSESVPRSRSKVSTYSYPEKVTVSVAWWQIDGWEQYCCKCLYIV